MTPTKVEEALAVLRLVFSEYKLKCCRSKGFDCEVCNGASEALTTLTAALAESERDAARYRWLRDEANLVHADAPDAPMVFVTPNDGGKIDWFMSRTGPSLDTAIDAAIKDTDHAR